MDMSPKARQERAEARADRVTRVDPGDDVSMPESGLGRIELAFALTRAAWSLTGKPWPSIPRAELSIRRVRAGDNS
ncbi:hypothetical protein DB30_01403 [Enhygromyxa salina]|uniref:Uncharacterized protein n=1 Tax=Enhygromyxa salina TaxID=215803 RepID=A0A0C1ZL85_9BACT|nr:hypothetical protein [Enhygromyxa salina]KIG18294.1 hypothetical protein DB30_01403 [Enhygromyxa salina]